MYQQPSKMVFRHPKVILAPLKKIQECLHLNKMFLLWNIAVKTTTEMNSLRQGCQQLPTILQILADETLLFFQAPKPYKLTACPSPPFFLIFTLNTKRDDETKNMSKMCKCTDFFASGISLMIRRTTSDLLQKPSSMPCKWVATLESWQPARMMELGKYMEVKTLEKWFLFRKVGYGPRELMFENHPKLLHSFLK